MPWVHENSKNHGRTFFNILTVRCIHLNVLKSLLVYDLGAWGIKSESLHSGTLLFVEGGGENGLNRRKGKYNHSGWAGA